MFTKTVALALISFSCLAQVTIPDGTKVRVALDQTITSATAEEGQAVELTVTDAVKVDGTVVIAEGARASGTIVLAQQKRRMGRAGKLDFSIDRVRSADGEWIPVRYTVNKKAGESKATSTGVLTAGAAIVFWPAAPFLLLRQGKDVTVNKGVTLDVYTDRNHELTQAPAPKAPAKTLLAANTAEATVVFDANEPGAEVEVDGAFVGSTPTTLKLTAGPHSVVIRKGAKVWQRTLQVNAGSNVNVTATLSNVAAARR